MQLREAGVPVMFDFLASHAFFLQSARIGFQREQDTTQDLGRGTAYGPDHGLVGMRPK
jgi:hypothetical protein